MKDWKKERIKKVKKRWATKEEEKKERERRGRERKREICRIDCYICFFFFFLYQVDHEARETRETESVMPEMCPIRSDWRWYDADTTSWQNWTEQTLYDMTRYDIMLKSGVEWEGKQHWHTSSLRYYSKRFISVSLNKQRNTQRQLMNTVWVWVCFCFKCFCSCWGRKSIYSVVPLESLHS